MKNDKIAELLIEGIGILKNIHKQNLEQNKIIEDFLKQVNVALGAAKEEDKKDENKDKKEKKEKKEEEPSWKEGVTGGAVEGMTDSEEKDISGGGHAGKIWCAVCNEWHDKETETTSHTPESETL